MASAGTLLTFSTFETKLDMWLVHKATGKDLFDMVLTKIGSWDLKNKFKYTFWYQDQQIFSLFSCEKFYSSGIMSGIERKRRNIFGVDFDLACQTTKESASA
jgi:hypothetical protein